MSARLLEQGLAWEWVDGVRLEAVEEAAPEEYSDLEAYRHSASEDGPGLYPPRGGLQAGHAECAGVGRVLRGGMGGHPPGATRG